MRAAWRRWFGWGSLQMGIALALLFEVPEYYMLLRLTLMNLVFYGPLRWRAATALPMPRSTAFA